LAFSGAVQVVIRLESLTLGAETGIAAVVVAHARRPGAAFRCAANVGVLPG